VHLQELGNTVVAISCKGKPLNFIGFCGEKSRFSARLTSGLKGVMTV